MSADRRISVDLDATARTPEGTLIGVGSFKGRRERLGRGSLILLLAAAVAAGCDSSITAAELPIDESSALPHQSVARLVASHTFVSLDVGAAANISAAAVDEKGAAVSDAKLSWTSLNPSIAMVDQRGLVKAVAPGIAKIAVRSGAISDTLAVAVLGTQNLLLLAGVDGSPAAEVRPGNQVTVPITLDMSKVSPTGDLGSIQFEFHYDPTVLEFVSGADDLAGTAAINLVEPGRLSFAFVSTDPQAKAALTLANLTFKVAADAPMGARSGFSILFASAPTASNFSRYSAPVTFGGSLRVVPV